MTDKFTSEQHEALKDLVGAIDDLIMESDGVAGLHLNGDMAPWSELTEGGRFEIWMISLENARKAISKATNEE